MAEVLGWALLASPFVVMAIWGLVQDWRGALWVAGVVLAIGLPICAGAYLLAEAGAL